MTSPTTANNGASFVWHDIMTSDPSAAQAFYTSALGWTTQDWSGPGEYTMFAASGAPRGGFMRLSEEQRRQGVPAHWLAYIGVRDVDASVRQAESLGARTLVQPQDIPGVGRFAVLQDPQGASFALYTHATELPESNEMSPVGDASWHELWTTDSDAAYAFYTTLFGWEGAGEFDMGRVMGVYRMFGRHGLPLGGMAKLRPDMKDSPPHWLPFFRVADIHQAAERVKTGGGSVLSDPKEVPGGDLVAQCMDPQRGVFALHQTKG